MTVYRPSSVDAWLWMANGKDALPSLSSNSKRSAPAPSRTTWRVAPASANEGLVHRGSRMASDMLLGPDAREPDLLERDFGVPQELTQLEGDTDVHHAMEFWARNLPATEGGAASTSMIGPGAR